MANIKSKKKHIKQTIKRTARNRHIKSNLKTLRKNFEISIEDKKKEKIEKAVAIYHSALDKAVKRGVVHKNKATRHKKYISKKTLP